jgi:hypothetical protein
MDNVSPSQLDIDTEEKLVCVLKFVYTSSWVSIPLFLIVGGVLRGIDGYERSLLGSDSLEWEYFRPMMAVNTLRQAIDIDPKNSDRMAVGAPVLPSHQRK